MKKNIIKQLNNYFSTIPVEKVWLFGSYARHEENRNSGIDLIVKFKKPVKFGLIMYFKILSKIENITGKKIDLVEDNQINFYAKSNIEKDKILIYERKTTR